MTDNDAAAAPRPDIGYEEARDELIEVVRKLETGGTTLEESLALWERGEHLASVCERWLEGARARLDKAVGEEESGAAADDDATDGETQDDAAGGQAADQEPA